MTELYADVYLRCGEKVFQISGSDLTFWGKLITAIQDPTKFSDWYQYAVLTYAQNIDFTNRVAETCFGFAGTM